MRWCVAMLMLIVFAATTKAEDDIAPSPFAQRGYYFTFSRMPAFGLDEWKQILDCVHVDGGNTVILWIGGGFRSRRFPETWEYNREHANIKEDFGNALIDYAHAKKIKVVLGLTPFGYDGVNQMTNTRPEWRATGPDGKPTSRFGFQSWGQNLCPSQDGAQQFMLDYARELCLDFYPSADGIMIESSDYAVCHCKDCGQKFYDREFRFVQSITADIRKRSRDAMVMVYPHYFSGAGTPGLGAKGTLQPFDANWTLFYTPHSAHPVADLTSKARGAIWSEDSVARHTPKTIRDAARRAKREGCSGYVPSLEVFNYVPTEPEEGVDYLVGKRLKPYGFGWLRDGQVPYNELPIRVNRIAYRAYSNNPDLSDGDFRKILGRELFGPSATSQATTDALFLQQLFAEGRTWCQAAPLVSPARVRTLRVADKLPEQKRAEYRETLNMVRAIESRYRDKGETLAEMHRIARWVTDQWTEESAKVLDP